ncbi:MAG TPA: hypothetical protein VHM28_04900 [Anaerolineales bacterium]|jgi:hypothetical protein|nr:hypothetical protein [Anaerolineales bacterium]
MAPSPRVLLSIDYEPWFALVRRFDRITDSRQRRDLDGGFSCSALSPILEQLGDGKASFYLVGEIADWYPELPAKIISAGHELGLHCQIHRHLYDEKELAEDIRATAPWRARYHIRGYRAPMVGISEAAYPLLEQNGFGYSSSIYAPSGTLLQKGNIWEIPVSTLKVFGGRDSYVAPRDYSLRLLANGEFPYGSSFSIGLLGGMILKIIEHELKAGHSPVIFLHPYELVPPADWPSRIARDLILNPLLLPFVRNKAGFLAELLRSFPVSPLGTFLDEAVGPSI